MSKKTKSRLETLRDSAPEMLSALKAVRDILHNALSDNYYDPKVFERLQRHIIEVLELAECGCKEEVHG